MTKLSKILFRRLRGMFRFRIERIARMEDAFEDWMRQRPRRGMNG